MAARRPLIVAAALSPALIADAGEVYELSQVFPLERIDHLIAGAVPMQLRKFATAQSGRSIVLWTHS